MSTLLLERSPDLDESFERDTRPRLDGAPLAGMADVHGRLTLDELITSLWEDLAVRGTGNCPVCASTMVSISCGGSDSQQGGSCPGCGSEIC